MHKDLGTNYWVHFPEVKGCFCAEETIEQAKSMAAIALKGHLEWLREDGDPIPSSLPYDVIRQEVYLEGLVEIFEVTIHLGDE